MANREIQKSDGSATIILGENLVASCVPEIRDDMKQILKEGFTHLIINFDQVSIVDSVGIGCLVAAHNSLIKLGGGLSVTGVSGEIFDLFHSMRLDRHFPVQLKDAEGSSKCPSPRMN